MKEKMQKYIDVLDDMVRDYNNKVYSSIKMTLTEVLFMKIYLVI